MNWLLEDPTIAIFVLVSSVGLGWAGWSQTGEVRWLLTGMGVFAVGAGLLLTEWLIETDPERIESALRRMGRACERQDAAALLAEIDPNAAALRQQAEIAMTHYRVTRAKFSELQVTINRVTVPPEARVTFLGTIQGAVRYDRGSEISGIARERFEMRFRQAPGDGQWRCLSATWQHAPDGFTD